MLFNLFKKKDKLPLVDYSAIHTDIHSHLIPGIDDGSQSMDESIILIKRMMDFGFKKLVTTPHIMADYYRNTSEIIVRGLDSVREELHRQNIDVEFEAAAEYYLDETFESKLEKRDILTIGENFLLFELSFVNYPKNLFEIIERIKDKGYTPLLAHPERYPYLTWGLENYQQIKEAGCYLQLNTVSLTGYYGKPTQKIAEELVDNMLVDFIGSDLHRMKHVDMLQQALRMPYVHKLLTDYQLQNKLV